METFSKKIISIILALAVLAILWYFYRDRFNISLIQSPESCKITLTASEESTITLLEKRAHEIISGKDTQDTTTDKTSDIDLTHPSLETLQKLINTNTLVNTALSRIRESIADGQTKNPESILGKEKKRIHSLFETGRSWCDKLSFIKK
jgi:hypothetical protein